MRPAISPEGPAATAALGNIANNVVAARRERFARRQRSSDWLVGDAREAAGLPRDVRDDPSASWVRPLRPARCRWRANNVVGVHCDGEHDYAHYSGLERCASIWSCPVCSVIIRSSRAKDISAAAEAAHLLGMGAAFITLTQRHHWGDSLAFTLDVMLTGWRKLQTRTAWRNLARRFGVVGNIRATEVTIGANGWHPHNHMLMFFERSLSVRQIAAFQASLGALWIAQCAKMGAGIPSEEHGARVVKVDKGGKVIAEYITKFQEGGQYTERKASIGLEIARGDLKTGKVGSLVPFQLLDASGPGSETARALWLEYVHATRGRRAFSWSRGLRDLLLPDVEELTDEEIIEEAEQAELVTIIPGMAFDATLRDNPELLAEVLELAEEGYAFLIPAAVGFDPPIDGGTE